MERLNFNSVFSMAILCSAFEGYAIESASYLESNIRNESIKVLTTTSDRKQDLAESFLSFSSLNDDLDNIITLLPEETFQTMDGFGAAITGSTCYNLMKMDDKSRDSFLRLTFSPENGYGFSYVRISIGCSDFSLSEFTCCDTPGIENFNITEEDRLFVMPILKHILEINPSLKIMGSPWTAPRWMKVNNLTNLEPQETWTGGQLNPKYYQDYALYFVKWIQEFEAAGIPIFSVTPQNEPLNRGNSASMYMPWEQERDFVKTALGPAFRKAGINTKIYAFDHNYNYDNIDSQNSYPTNIYSDAEAANFLSGAAFHNYGGDKDELIVVHDAAPGKDLVFSETSIGTWNMGRDLSVRLDDDMREVGLGTINRWCKGVIVWNLMLDENGAPNRPGGCTTCYGAVDINLDYTQITRNSHYYVIAHLASVVKPDAVRIGTKGFSAEGLTYSAFRNIDGSFALVLNNSNDSDISFSINDGNNMFSYTMPAHSVVSLQWN